MENKYEKYDYTIRQKGISSITSASNPDYELWIKENYDVLKKYSQKDVKTIFINSLMDAKYGADVRNSVPLSQREAYIENEVWNSYLEDNFSSDDRLSDISRLTVEGKRHLLESGYMTPNELDIEEQRQIDIAREAEKTTSGDGIDYGDGWLADFGEWVVESMMRTQDPGGAYGVSPASLTSQSVSIIEDTTRENLEKKQDKILDKELELDKGRIIVETSDTYTQYFDLLSKRSDEDITTEFDKIGSGYDITIEDENAGAAIYHMPGSNYYNTFKDTKYLNNLSADQKRKYLAQYYAIADAYGIENAIYYLDSELQNLIADKQTWYEKTWNTVSGVVKDIPAALAQTALTFYGMVKYGIIEGSKEDFALYLQGIDPADGKKIQDGFNVSYWSKAQEYDTWNSSLIAEADRNGGVSENRSVWTKEQEQDWLSAKTLADVGEQAVWVGVTLLTSGGTGAAGKLGNKLLGKGVKTLTGLAKTEDTAAKIVAGAEMLQGVGRYAKLAIDAAPIAATEAYGAFTETLDTNLGKVQTLIEDTATNRTIQALNEKLHQDNIKRRADEAYFKFLKENPEIPVEEVDYNTFLEKATEEYTYILKNKYIKEEEENFSEEKEKAATSAVDAFNTTLVMSTIKTAGTNIGFKHFLYGAPFRKNFNINSPNIATRITKEGLLEVVEPSKYAKYVAPLVRNTFGEAFDEFMDTEIAALGIGYGTGKFNYYLNNENSDIEGFDSVLAGLGNALVMGKENLTDEQSYREAFLGLIAGGANIMPTFRLSKPKEGSTFLEKIDHYLMNPVLHDILETKQETAAMKEKVKEINEVLKQYSSIAESAGNIIQAASDLHRATMAGYDVGMKGAKQDLGATLMLSIENLEEDSSLSNHNLTSQVLETIERASRGDITDEEVNDFFNQEVNRDLKGKITFEEAKDIIQENAKKLLETRKEIKKIKQELGFDSRFTELSTVAQNGVIRNILKSKDYRERAASIKRNLGISSGEKSMVVVGSKRDYTIKEKALKDTIEELERKKDKVKSSSKKENKEAFEVSSKKSKKGLLKEIDRSIAKVKKELSLLQTSASFSDDSEFNETILSKSQILNLDSNNLAYILDPKNSSYFSPSQREIIEEAREELEKTISGSSDLTYFPTVDNPSYYAKVVADLENGAELIDRHTQVFLNYANDGKSADNHISEESNILTEKQKIATWNHHFNNTLYTSEGTLIDDNNKIVNSLTFADPKAVHKFLEENKLSEKFPNVYQRSLAWQQFLDVIGFDKSSIEDKRQALMIVKSLLENDINISDAKELADAISSISENFSPEINKILNNYLESLGIIKKQREATRKIDKKKQTPEVNDDDLVGLEDDDTESKEEERKEDNEAEKDKEESKESEPSEQDNEDLTNEQADTSLEYMVSESSVEEVKSTTINDPKILNPVEDSILPDDEDLLKSDSPEMQGNTHYRYNGKDARNGTLKERVGEEEKDTTNSVFEWLSINKIRLQEIIDNELSSIADTDPEVHFMMLTSPQYGEGFSLNNVVFQVIEYTDVVKKIHKEDRGGVINSNGKEYLIIGTSGYSNNNEVAVDGYIKLLNRLKRGRKHHSGPYFISSDYTKIKKIEAGWVVNSVGEEGTKSRNIKELFDDPTRNPHKLSLKRSKWLIQERTKVVTVRVNNNEVVHSPIDAIGNSGAIFLMVPAANGHFIPISVKPKLLHEMTEMSTLRDRISKTIAGLTAKNFEARLAAKRELSKLLVISKEGEGVFISKDDNKISITYMGGKGNISIDLNAVDATAQLERAFFSEQAGFKLNLSEAILGQHLDDYIEAGVLTTDAKILGTVNASYTVYGVNENGKPIIEKEITPEISTNKIELSDYISPSGNVIYLGNEYHEKDGAFYDSSGNIINDLDLIVKIKTAKYLAKHKDKKPTRSDSKVDIYILSDDTSEPKVVRVIKSTGKIEILGKNAALHEIKQQKKLIAKDNKEKESKIKLRELEEEVIEEDTPEEDVSEDSKSIDDLVSEFIPSEDSEGSNEETPNGVINAINEAVEGEKSTVTKQDNHILSDGIAVSAESNSMKTSDFLGSPAVLTDEYFEILEDLKLTELQGEALESKLRELEVPDFIDPNDPNSVNAVFKILNNCRNKQ